MNSPDPTNQIHALEISIEKLIAKPAVAGDGTAASLASQMMQKDNLKQDLMMQVRANQNQMIKDQMEQARLRSEMAYKDQQAQGRALQEQTQRDRQTQAKLRQEQIERYEQQQARLKQEQQQREQLDQARRRLEQQQRDQLQQSRMRQEQIQREQQMQARLKQEQQLQKDRAEQEKLGGKFGEKNTGKPGDKNNGKPKTAEQLAKDEEARAFSARSELSLTSIAFCSPLMLFGMGAAMSIFDNFSSKGKNQAMLEQRKKNAQQQELSEYARAQADKKFKEMLEGKNLTNQSNLSMDANAANAVNFGVEKGEKRSEKAVKEEREKQKRVNRFIEAEQNPVVARKNDSLEVKKLWKERQRLLENLERVRGQGSLALVSKLVSQLETLDRSLKRLGCDPQA